ncbi:MAG: fibronectin type III domain-containing protein [Chloroflexota bacterium]|nr:fibronectin type III domain-containing protein [Chloroflexota bacterium]
MYCEIRAVCSAGRPHSFRHGGHPISAPAHFAAALLALVALSLVACAPVEADLEGTVEAQVRERVQATIDAMPTASPTPTPTAVLTPTATPTPVSTPTPAVMATLTSAPTPTPVQSGRDPYTDGQPPRFLWHYPDPPRGLTARGVSGDSVILEWEPTYGASGYDVLYYAYTEALTHEELANSEDHALFDSAFASTGDLFTTEASQEISGLDCEQTYLFEVRALGGGVYIDTVYPARKDYGPPSRVVVSPCDTRPAMSETHTGLFPDGGDDCLTRLGHWPPFQAVYSYFHPESWTHDCADGEYYESRLQLKHIDYRGPVDHRTTVIADLDWAHDDVRCSGGGVALDGVGSYEEQKGLVHTTYDAIDVRAHVERGKVLSVNFGGDLTSNLYYVEGIYGRDNALAEAALLLLGIDPSVGIERPEGVTEDHDGVCYRNVCASEDAAIRFGDDLVTNDRFQIPLALQSVSRTGDSIRVHMLWIDAEREVR